MSRRNLRGRVALVTGASSGLGFEAALQLARAGMRLCVTARGEPGLQSLVERVTREGGECVAAPGDATSDEDVRGIVARCLDAHGRVDLLVNSAAVQVYAKFEELSWEEIRRVVEVNLFGYLRFAREVLPHMRVQGDGHIINVLSVLSKANLPLFSMYSTTKHGLLGWSEALRRELQGSGIEVSAILMPAIATPLYDHVRTRLPGAPRPLPPIYSTEWAAKRIVRCARRPRTVMTPSAFQGRSTVLAAHAFRGVVDLLSRRILVRAQYRKRVPPPTVDNLFQPGPSGGEVDSRTLKATPNVVRWAMGAAAAGAALTGLWAARRVSS